MELLPNDPELELPRNRDWDEPDTECEKSSVGRAEPLPGPRLLVPAWEEPEEPWELELEEKLTWAWAGPGLNTTVPEGPLWETPELLEPEAELLKVLLEPSWLLRLLPPEWPFIRKQGSLGEVIRVGSLQGSEKVRMLLAKVPGERSSGQSGRERTLPPAPVTLVSPGGTQQSSGAQEREKQLKDTEVAGDGQCPCSRKRV